MRGRGIANLLCLALCVAASQAQTPAAAAAPEKDINDALSRCLITPAMLAGFDYTPVKAGCDAARPLEQRCESCACSLTTGFTGLLEKAGYTVGGAPITEADAQVAVTNCLDTVVPALTAAGVDINTIIELAGCAATPSCLNLGAGEPRAAP